MPGTGGELTNAASPAARNRPENIAARRMKRPEDSTWESASGVSIPKRRPYYEALSGKRKRPSVPESEVAISTLSGHSTPVVEVMKAHLSQISRSRPQAIAQDAPAKSDSSAEFGAPAMIVEMQPFIRSPRSKIWLEQRD